MARRRWMVVLGLAAVVATFGRSAHAGTGSMELTCWKGTTSTGIDWADIPIYYETTSATATQSVGAQFGPDGTYGPQIECSFHVPEDYNDAGSPPEVLISGWSIANDSCSATENVRFAVTSRAFSSDALTASWPTEIVASLSFACVTNGCGVGIDCNKKDLRKSTNFDVTAAASDWNIRDQVFVRIRRDTPHSGDTLGQTFHLASVTLIYPTP